MSAERTNTRKPRSHHEATASNALPSPRPFQKQGGGEPAESCRHKAEASLRHDFSELRVHDKPSSAPRASHQTVVQRVVYGTMPLMIAGIWPAAAGAPPNVAGFSRTLRGLFNEAAGFLAQTDIVADPALPRIAETSLNPPAAAQPYIVRYNPTDPSAVGDPQFLLASVLHELIHVSTQENYRNNARAGDWVNMNLPAGVGLPPAVVAEINAQLVTLDQNLQDAVAETQADANLAVALRNHVLDRLIHYAMPMPDVHYDTVLTDILAYLEMNGVNTGRCYSFILRLIKEANNRRLVDPWWGTKSARRVDRNKKWWQFWKW